MAFIPSLISMGAGILGNIFGKKGKADDRTYAAAIQNLDKLYGSLQAEGGGYKTDVRNAVNYFSQGGSATAVNRQKAMVGAVSPIDQLIPDIRTRNQNAMARAGIVTPGTVSAKSEMDTGIKAAWQRSMAVDEVNQRFDKMLDQNKAIAGQLAAAQIAQIRNLLANLVEAKGKFGLEERKLNIMESQQEGGIFDSLLGSGAGGMMEWLDGIFGKKGGKSLKNFGTND